nr:hypothetical protein [Neisseria gonorrhoeae]
MRVERRQCAEHGGYAAKSVLRGVWTGCPACRKLEAADEMAAYAETLRRGRCATRWKNASGVRASPAVQKLPD